MTDKLEFKAMSGQLTIDEAEGVVECFVAALGNKDSVGDIVVPGAFTSSLKRRKPRVVWGHDWNQPIGKVLDIYEVGPSDPRLPGKMKAAGVGGLFAKVQFNLRSERGREAFHSILFFGEEQEWSIGYKTLDSIYSPERQANMLKEVELYEVSPVLHGANQLTATISIKSEKQDKKENRVTSFRESKWETFDPSFAEMIKEKYPSIWRKGGNIRGNDQYSKLLPLYRRGGTANSEMEINALELREAWVARHRGDFRLPGVVAQIKWLAVGSRGEAYMKNLIREEIKKIEQKSETEGDIKGGVTYSNYTTFSDADDLGGYKYNGEYSEEKAEEEGGCPPATSDIELNLKNRQKAINSVGYGPLNPSEPNNEFWAKKADQWDVSPDEAKKQRCGNCAAFVKTEQMLACIEKGLGNEPGNDAIDVIEAGDLGYCEALDFKCAAARTCDAWISGGPVTKGHGEDYDNGYESESSDDDPMEELERMAMMMGDGSMEPKDILERALSEEFQRPVEIRTITGNTVVFDAMSDSGKKMTARASWHAERGQVMIGRPERVRVETVYIPLEDDSEGQAYEGDSEKDCGCGCGGKGSCGTIMKSEEVLFVPLGHDVEVKAPIPPDAIPQERITGDVLRGYGPRRGNLERLLRYWRPIMRKPGGFRRCRVILADHPELYPLNNICAWLHHETTGLWPNEGCHHPGMKNCRRKLRGVVRGSLFSDSEFNDRLRKLRPNPSEKGMGYYEDDEDMEPSMDEAVRELKMFCKAEPRFIKMLRDEAAWEHEGEDEMGMKNVHSAEYAKEDCNCDHSASDSDIFSDSLKGLFEDVDLKAGRAINGRNVEKIRKIIAMLEEIVGASSPIESVEMKSDGLIVAPTENIPLVGDAITPVASYYNFEIEVTDDGIQVTDFSDLSEDAKSAIDTALGNIAEIQVKGIGRSIRGGGGRYIPHDGDGDGFFSPAPGAPDKTPIANLPDADKPRRIGMMYQEPVHTSLFLPPSRRTDTRTGPSRKKPVDRLTDDEIKKEIDDYDKAQDVNPLTAAQRNRRHNLRSEQRRRAENKRRAAAGEETLEEEAYMKPSRDKRKRQERNDKERTLAAQAVSTFPRIEQLKAATAVKDSVVEREAQKIRDELKRLKKVRASIRVENAAMFNMANDTAFRKSDFDSPEDEALAKQTDQYIKIAEERLKMVLALPRA